MVEKVVIVGPAGDTIEIDRQQKVAKVGNLYVAGDQASVDEAVKREMAKKAPSRPARKKVLKKKEPDNLPNMPKRYPCPTCRRPCRRKEKLATGAVYHCGQHGNFTINRR